MAAFSRRVLLLAVLSTFLVIQAEETADKKINNEIPFDRFKRRSALAGGSNNKLGGGDQQQHFNGANVNAPIQGGIQFNAQNHLPNNQIGKIPGGLPKMSDRGNIQGNFDQRFQAQPQPVVANQMPGLPMMKDSARMKASLTDRQGRLPKKSSFKLAETPQCAEDIAARCSLKQQKNNFAILDCLQNDAKVAEEVSSDCQHFIWEYRRNLTRDDRFEYAADEVCMKEMEENQECRKLRKGDGQIIPCLVENMENITGNCRTYLNKMAKIVFSDYRLVYGFMMECNDDIVAHKCGRLEFENDESIHSQGKTLHCLAKKIGILKDSCKKQLLRVAELQADDFHLDRPLFYACRQDREEICPNTVAGQGRIYECLFKHKFDKMMSEECREKLTVRQQLIALDVKAEKTFFEACRLDIRNNHCFSTGHGPGEDARRAGVLLCLENHHKRDEAISPECLAEMMDLRKTLMEDYKITPEIVAGCAKDVAALCGGGLSRGGNTIHCLMEHARNQHKEHHQQLESTCLRALEDLLNEVDVGSDFRMDKNLQSACQEVVNVVCRDVQPGDAEVINCLMDRLDSEHMTDLCEEKLMQIQYFIVRNFGLDTTLYKHCHQDAFKLCHAPKTWLNPGSTDVDNSPMILPCLFRHMKDHDTDPSLQVSRACKHEILRVMRLRAKRVELDPEIENNCVVDLGKFCSDKVENFEKGEELACLQDNYDDLEDDCQEIVGNFTEAQDTYLELDNLIMKSCMPMIKKFCDEEVADEADAEDIMDCLIDNKHDPEMDDKCAAGIEHHQIVSLQDFRFNHKFKEACKESVMTFCKGRKTKYDVVTCLSEHVRNDTIMERKKHRISKPCRKQLRVEVLQRGEKVELDHDLVAACKDELQEVCGDVEHGNAKAIECLKEHYKRLGPKCQKVVFVREKDDAYIGDFKLNQACAKMIKVHCKTVLQTDGDVMHCLQKYKDDPEFDGKCRAFVIKRQVIQNQDYRLNPSLRKSCKMDIKKFCGSIVQNEKNDEELEGKVINCLRKQFAVNRLSRDCNAEIRDVIRGAALNYLEDPVLAKACKQQIETFCTEEHSKALRNENEVVIREDGRGAVVECLRKNIKSFADTECEKEVARTMQEAHVDVAVDPLLHTACQQDLRKYCYHINPGHGRQMNCLLIELEDRPDGLSTECRNLLSKRKDLWEFSVRVAPIEGFQEIYDQISISPAKNYILSILIVVLGLIFLVGMTCGRVTKRAKGDKSK